MSFAIPYVYLPEFVDDEGLLSESSYSAWDSRILRWPWDRCVLSYSKTTMGQRGRFFHGLTARVGVLDDIFVAIIFYAPGGISFAAEYEMDNETSPYCYGEVKYAITEPIMDLLRGRFDGVEERDILRHLGDVAMAPIRQTLQLLHCRNVETIDRPLSRQQRKKMERGEPTYVYKTLVVRSGKQVRPVYDVERDPDSKSNRRLHICRGHFATYTDDAPLFGKHVGTFWVPMHVRGNRSAGTVVKDYAVEPPDN